MRTLLIFIAISLTTGAMAQKKDKEVNEITIQTSAVCEMCKATIEEGLGFAKGVRESNVDIETSKVVIKYRTDKTTPEQLREVIAKLGYVADEVVPTTKDYNSLHGCCKDPSVKPIESKK